MIPYLLLTLVLKDVSSIPKSEVKNPIIDGHDK